MLDDPWSSGMSSLYNGLNRRRRVRPRFRPGFRPRKRTGLTSAIEVIHSQVAEVLDVRPQLPLRILCHSSMLTRPRLGPKSPGPMVEKTPVETMPVAARLVRKKERLVRKNQRWLDCLNRKHKLHMPLLDLILRHAACFH